MIAGDRPPLHPWPTTVPAAAPNPNATNDDPVQASDPLRCSSEPPGRRCPCEPRQRRPPTKRGPHLTHAYNHGPAKCKRAYALATYLLRPPFAHDAVEALGPSRRCAARARAARSWEVVVGEDASGVGRRQSPIAPRACSFGVICGEVAGPRLGLRRAGQGRSDRSPTCCFLSSVDPQPRGRSPNATGAGAEP